MNANVWPYETADNERLYVLGDIHGQSHLLRRIRELIARDLERRPTTHYRVICLGDLVDRGEFSKQVIDDLILWTSKEDWIVLRGNHEDMVLRVLSDALFLSEWCRYGGIETLLSFGVPLKPMPKEQDFKQAHALFSEKFGEQRTEFLERLPLNYASGSYFLCHAGVRPLVPLKDQSPNDLMWIREEFLNFEGQHEKFIVHGHTPIEAVTLHSNRINLDTGAYITGRLSCLVLEGKTGAIFDTRNTEFTSIF